MELGKEGISFLRDMNISEELFAKSGLEITILQDIVEDYKKNELALLDEAEYVAKKLQRCSTVHSVRWRIKDSKHLVRKIIRKLTDGEPVEKYKTISVDNYKNIITDLIGVRAIYLFKSDWQIVHEHIRSRWNLKENEKVVIYHRNGDDLRMYSGYPDCIKEQHAHAYRSIHYIIPVAHIQSKQVFCEIQSRTIFEEGWSEIDHKVRYPDFSEDENLKGYLQIFNRLAGGADEMGDYVGDLVALIKKNQDLEIEREAQESQALHEKAELENSIQSLTLDTEASRALKDMYEQLFNIQKQENERLKAALNSQTDENIRLNKIPVITNLKQNDFTTSFDDYTGEIEFEVIRTNKFVSFSGRFNPRFDSIPEVEVNIVSAEAPDTDISDLRVSVGVGVNTNFNVHLFNDKLGCVAIGKYKFSFKAYKKTA